MKHPFAAQAADLRDDDAHACRWLANNLRRDGRVTVEPFLDILAEFTGEWVQGAFVGVSRPRVDHMRWHGQWLGDPATGLDGDVYDLVYEQRALETHLHRLDVPKTCGSPTCGVDVAVVRDPSTGALETRVMELNARTTMSHVALAAKTRIPSAKTFEIIRKADLQAHHLPITDPATATAFVAVLELDAHPDTAPGA